MFSGDELRVYLISLKCIGLLYVTHDVSQPYRIYASDLDHTLTVVGLTLLQLFIWVAFAQLLRMPETFTLPQYTAVGNTYFVINFGVICIVISLIYLGFYASRQRLLAVLAFVLYHNHRDLRNCHAKRFLKLYYMYVGLTVICAITYTGAFRFANLRIVPSILLSFIHTYSFLLIGLIIILYSCLTQILAALLHLYNRELLAAITAVATPGVTRTATTTINRLYKRNQMLIVCHEQLNSVFGPFLALITALCLMSAPIAPFFLITIVFKMDVKQIGLLNIFKALYTCLLWNIPWAAGLIMVFRQDIVRQEANKTAKILAKIPRTGSGLDKMVEKFLLKNLRQQPILTAYGFFALDKSTLFKLFTAIFTYMVILVQFKEMENSTKSLQKS
ncbi:gustatory and pheromone receptor 39a isoform X1 [Drosophila navojoa]|uniref:gustatory and pheromone receptor 39a isoform X1 n=1 Tax=Drosophila navojoa TaxID=7232 RepID=UPI0011BE1FFD|nr:gustatory and pheromone receptor 39a isoform X1 [Drosophila navojoa]